MTNGPGASRRRVPMLFSCVVWVVAGCARSLRPVYGGRSPRRGAVAIADATLVRVVVRLSDQDRAEFQLLLPVRGRKALLTQ